jgi:transcriptional regulator with XRE-family HTH domain
MVEQRSVRAGVGNGGRSGPSEDLTGIGDRLRDERVKSGLSQRELARRLGLSPSLISQLESGVSKPSVGTLYAIVTELDVSLDHIIRGEDHDGRVSSEPEREPSGRLVHPQDRDYIDLDSGVRWEQLTRNTENGVDFLHAIYEVGGTSTPEESLMRHHGHEYGYIVSGRLGIQLGFERYELSAGDSIDFDSTRPHRLYNLGDEPVHAIWLVVGRQADARLD